VSGFEIPYLSFFWLEMMTVFNFFSEYQVCDAKYFTREVCSQYPAWQPCGCPLKAGGYALNDVKVALPDIGLLKPIVVVSATINMRCPFAG
jgi:hypothetical protein